MHFEREAMEFEFYVFSMRTTMDLIEVVQRISKCPRLVNLAYEKFPSELAEAMRALTVYWDGRLEKLVATDRSGFRSHREMKRDMRVHAVNVAMKLILRLTRAHPKEEVGVEAAMKTFPSIIEKRMRYLVEYLEHSLDYMLQEEDVESEAQEEEFPEYVFAGQTAADDA